MKKYYPGEQFNTHIQSLINILHEKNWVITIKKGKGKLPKFCGNREWVITIYASKWSYLFLQYSPILSDGFYPCALSRLSVGGGWRTIRGVGGLKLVSSGRCVRCDFGAKYLLRQTQSQYRHPLWFPGPQGAWISIFAEYLGVIPRDGNCDMAVNRSCDVRNVFVQFRCHE